MRPTPPRILATGALLILLLLLPGAAAETAGHDQIIYISSYGPGYIWNQEMEAGIEAAIADSERTRIQLSIEYLDAKAINDATHFENLYQTFAHKYRTASPDVIIISDDAALLFMNDYGDRLFPGVPVVFTGINNASNLPDAGDETAFYIGTLEILPVQETIDVIRNINPETDTIYVILDNSYTGRAIRTQINEQTAGRTGAITYLYPEVGADINAISADLADLPDTAAVLIITYYLADQDLTPYHIDEISAELSAASPVPLYSAVSVYNNRGVVGGVQISPYDLGYHAGTHALWVLDEKPLTGTGPVIHTPETISLFDYTEMQRYGISESDLPEGATIINQPSDSITVDRTVAFGVSTVALILGILVVILIFQNVALTNTRVLLTKSEHLYRSVVEGQTEMITRFRTDGAIIFINRAYARYFGLDPETIEGKKFRPCIHEDDRERVAAHFAALRAGNAHQTIEQRILLDDGTVRWQRWDDHAIFDENGAVAEYQSVGMDITEQKEAEQKIRDSLQEKTVLLQEVHHRVKNNLAVISSMLEMQAAKEEERDPYVATEIREAEGRIRSMAAVHEELYRSDSFGAIDVQSHFERLAHEIISTFPDAAKVTLNVKADDCRLSLETAIPVSLILNELLTNAMKYAFVGTPEYIITIQMKYDRANTTLTVSDSGVGFPDKYDPEQATTLGIRMVKTFVEYQLDGSYEIATGPGGTTWTIRFPSDNE
ncbi:PAS domain S-box protein [Methanogenium sp. S4BF]|uniref:histidine kinase dimerization/phosphoacceptor domain -containing protein n=1 Tax=Methanogenium sp. S4BF TaxID=1789226 RepID=UPI002415FD1C|nr:histidine kinase dimerization/phosphoacceptor domain -containing protein [Methanogenium sp. S4BF]WFN34180.1 PAS domain S-box protein [Methanogenium sp. S4BF]